MWIRSQNRKRLVNASHVYVSESNYIISACAEGYFEVGEYETEERCLEVLSDFEASIAAYEFVKSTGQGLDTLVNRLNDQQRVRQLINLFIFQMPEE